MSKTNSQFLISITPSRDGLLTALRPFLTDELILEMAKWDVPVAEDNQIALAEIRDSAIVPGRLPWSPAEACNMLRWQVQTNQLVSTMKLFACWILVRAYMQPESLESGLVEVGDEHTIAGLVEAALDLGQDYPRQTASFLYWAYLSLLNAGAYPKEYPFYLGEYRNEVRPFYLFGLLILAASMPSLVSNEKILTIEQKLDEEERRVRTWMEIHRYTSTIPAFSLWLLGLADNDVGELHSRYYNLAQRARSTLRTNEDEKRRRYLDDIIARWDAIAS